MYFCNKNIVKVMTFFVFFVSFSFLAFGQELTELQKELYSKFTCKHFSGAPIDKAKCADSQEVMAYVDALIEMGVNKEEILLKTARKYSPNIIIDYKTREEVKLKLIKEIGDKRPQISLDYETHDFGTVSKKQGKINKVFKVYNKGNVDLVVKNIKASCTCSTVALYLDKEAPVYFGTQGTPSDWQKIIKPNSFANLDFVLDLADEKVRLGKVQRVAVVASNDPLSKETKVQIEAEVKE